ncbi:hypothetical protein HG531_009340 [Fusarium graminearum]|nr:hypothetical protein HG531_009340 [Fusarium graminearum]
MQTELTQRQRLIPRGLRQRPALAVQSEAALQEFEPPDVGGPQTLLLHSDPAVVQSASTEQASPSLPPPPETMQTELTQRQIGAVAVDGTGISVVATSRSCDAERINAETEVDAQGTETKTSVGGTVSSCVAVCASVIRVRSTGIVIQTYRSCRGAVAVDGTGISVVATSYRICNTDGVETYADVDTQRREAKTGVGSAVIRSGAIRTSVVRVRSAYIGIQAHGAWAGAIIIFSTSRPITATPWAVNHTDSINTDTESIDTEIYVDNAVIVCRAYGSGYTEIDKTIGGAKAKLRQTVVVCRAWKLGLCGRWLGCCESNRCGGLTICSIEGCYFRIGGRVDGVGKSDSGSCQSNSRSWFAVRSVECSDFGTVGCFSITGEGNRGSGFSIRSIKRSQFGAIIGQCDSGCRVTIWPIESGKFRAFGISRGRSSLGVSGNGLLNADAVNTAANVLAIEKTGVVVSETIFVSSTGCGSGWWGREVVRGGWSVILSTGRVTWGKIWINKTKLILANADIITSNNAQLHVKIAIAID